MTITALPTPPRRSQGPATFSTAADTFMAALPTFATEANALVLDVNGIRDATAVIKAATEAIRDQAAGSATAAADSAATASTRAAESAASANFVGPWSSLSGPLNMPASVLHNGSTWRLLANLPDVAASEPGVSGDWDAVSLMSAALTDPGPICVTQEKTIAITNYDGFSAYSVSAARGAATISGDAITYTAPATDGADTLTVTLNGVGRDIALDILPATVSAPTITSPAESAEISPSNVTIITSAFAPIGSADTHAKSQYVIRDSGGTIVYDSGESDDLASITIPSLGLTRGESYTIEARHKGATLGWSGWSAPRSVSISVITRGMRIDNKATVIGNADGSPFTINGQQVWIAVLDAAYRGVSIKFGTYGYDSTLPNVTSSLGTMTQGESESAMDARAAAETGNSKGNCDVWMTRNGITDSQSIVGVPAVAMCRAIALDGTPCDLPTAKVLMRIWQHRDFIDTNDPTAAANTAKKLSAWGFGSARGAYVWSSSEYSSYNPVCVGSGGDVIYYDKSGQFGVVPVLEIPA